MGDPNPAVQDPAFRHALGYAINREEIVSKVYQGLGSPGASIVPKGNRFQWQPPPSEAYRFDLAKAGQLLDAAGYTKGSDGLRDLPDGKPIGTLRLDARAESPTSIGTMNYFKEWLGDLGIDATVDVMSGDKLTDIILSGDYDIFQWGWLADPDPDSILSYMTCWQRGNWSDSWFCNKQYDAWYAEQHTELDPAKRQVILDKMQQMIYLQAPYLVTTYGATGEAYRNDRFTGFTPQPSPNGVYFIQFGPYNYVHATPVNGGGTEAFYDQESRNRKMFLVLLCGTLVLCLGAGYVVSRQRALTADDRP
jgi:peptide/nickel transport system substrate-binding protein